MGGSRCIDTAILRDADDPERFASAANGALENRNCNPKNWRLDVVAVIEPSTEPFVYKAGGVDRDDGVDGFDPHDWDDLNLHGAGGMKVPLDAWLLNGST